MKLSLLKMFRSLLFPVLSQGLSQSISGFWGNLFPQVSFSRSLFGQRRRVGFFDLQFNFITLGNPRSPSISFSSRSQIVTSVWIYGRKMRNPVSFPGTKVFQRDLLKDFKLEKFFSIFIPRSLKIGVMMRTRGEIREMFSPSKVNGSSSTSYIDFSCWEALDFINRSVRIGHMLWVLVTRRVGGCSTIAADIVYYIVKSPYNTTCPT